MRAEEIHRKKLKELGCKDDHIEELVNKYIANCTYEFAEEYQAELLNIDSVSKRSELLIAFFKWRKGEQLTSETITEINNYLADESNS